MRFFAAKLGISLWHVSGTSPAKTGLDFYSWRDQGNSTRSHRAKASLKSPQKRLTDGPKARNDFSPNCPGMNPIVELPGQTVEMAGSAARVKELGHGVEYVRCARPCPGFTRETKRPFLSLHRGGERLSEVGRVPEYEPLLSWPGRQR